jgi:hypothetical protein
MVSFGYNKTPSKSIVPSFSETALFIFSQGLAIMNSAVI